VCSSELTSPRKRRQIELEEDRGFGRSPKERAMKKAKFSKKQIACVIQQVEAGSPVADA
jgi:hypothetical protein